MALLGKILQALAAAVPAFLAWLERRQAAKSQAEAEARRAAVRDDPGSAWVRKFNSQANPSSDSGAPGLDQPDGHK